MMAWGWQETEPETFHMQLAGEGDGIHLLAHKNRKPATENSLGLPKSLTDWAEETL